MCPPVRAALSLLPLGRGHEAMICGREHFAAAARYGDGAAANHLAELVRGQLNDTARRPPHPVLPTTFSPRGEGTMRP